MEKSNKKFKTDYLIIGNSAAGLSAAGSIRTADKNGKITVLSYEGHFNYSKPLITYYLADKIGLEKIYFKDRDFYSSNNIELKLDSEVQFIDADKGYVKNNTGDEYYFNKLLISTGGKPLIPKIDIINEKAEKEKQKKEKSELTGRIETLKNAFTLTTLDDAIFLKKYIKENNIGEAVILGGGLIGLKAAEAFLELGIRINIIELSDRILPVSFDSTAAEMIGKKINFANGNIFSDTTIDKIYVKDDNIHKLRLSNGKVIDCKLLVVAIGVMPDTGMVRAAGIKTEKGIIVDKYMKTSAKNIYSAGDAVITEDMLSGIQRNLAIWPLAVRQGRIAGINMAQAAALNTSKQKASYDGGFLMNSFEILGVPVISVGASRIEEGEDENIKVYRHYKPENDIYRKIITRDEKVIGALFIGSIDRAGIYTGLISNSVDISDIRKNIAAEDFGIIQLPADYKKHLVTGDGIEV